MIITLMRILWSRRLSSRTFGGDAQAARKRLGRHFVRNGRRRRRGCWIALASASHYSIGEARAAARKAHGESAAGRARGAAALRGEARARHHPGGRETARREPEPVSCMMCGADAEMPSVRFALETAVVGLIARSPSALYASALGRGARGSVDVAALVDGGGRMRPHFCPIASSSSRQYWNRSATRRASATPSRSTTRCASMPIEGGPRASGVPLALGRRAARLRGGAALFFE